MNKKAFFDKGLPKWPALLVVGNSVTHEQAMEIIIRTDSFSFSCNDKAWGKQLNKIVFNVESTGWNRHEDISTMLGITKDWNSVSIYEKECHDVVLPLDIYYLSNQRIASSWIGGPHGWCSWSGEIGTTNYNIGKYPSVEEVYNEWKIIAAAFPFLELTCQLLNCEAGESDVVPEAVVEYRIKNGKVTMVDPKSVIAVAKFGEDDMLRRFTDPNAERGCTIQQFEEAFNYVKNKHVKE